MTLGVACDLEEIDPKKCPKCGLKPRLEIVEKYLKIREKVEKILNANYIPKGAPEHCVRYSCYPEQFTRSNHATSRNFSG